MKHKTKTTLFGLILLSLAFLCYNLSELHLIHTTTAIKHVTAMAISETTYEQKMNVNDDIRDLKPFSGFGGETKRTILSDIPNLYADVVFPSIFWERNKVVVHWKNRVASINTGNILVILWRPKHPGFLYWIEHPLIGIETLHYVSITLKANSIKLNDKIISIRPVDTGLRWSSDGKYYLYSNFSGLFICEFATHKEWIIDEIDIKEGTRVFTIHGNQKPKAICNPFWTRNGFIYFYHTSDIDSYNEDGENYVIYHHGKLAVEQLGLK